MAATLLDMGTIAAVPSWSLPIFILSSFVSITFGAFLWTTPLNISCATTISQRPEHLRTLLDQRRPDLSLLFLGAINYPVDPATDLRGAIEERIGSCSDQPGIAAFGSDPSGRT